MQKSKQLLKIIAVLLLLAVGTSLAGCNTTGSVWKGVKGSLPPVPAKTSPAPSPSPEQKPDDGSSKPVVAPEQSKQPEATREPKSAMQKGYASTADLIFEIADEMQKVMVDLAPTDVRRAPGGFGDPVYSNNYKVFMSFFLMNTKDLNEDQAKMDEVLYRWKEKLGCKDAQIFHDSPHHYRLTGTWPQSDDTFEIHCLYDEHTGALQVLCNENEKLRESVEFKPLGSGRFALQRYDGYSGYEKALVTYRNGKIFDFHYASLFMATKYRCIYPDGQGLDTAWLDEDSEISYIAEIRYDGTELSYWRGLNA